MKPLAQYRQEIALLKIPDAKASLDALISRPYDNAESTFYAAKKILLAQYPLQLEKTWIREAAKTRPRLMLWLVVCSFPYRETMA